MLVIALGFGTGVIARTRPQSMEWTTTTGDRLGAARPRPAPRRRPRPRDPGERRRYSQHRAATAGASTSSSSSLATPVAWLRISSQNKWQQEAVAAANAASAGLLRRLWLRPDGLPAVGVWQATDRETLDRVLEGLPMAL